MIKKLLTSVAVAFVFAGAVTAAGLNSEERPTIQFIKDHEVIESRQMNDAEFEAFQALEQIEIKIEDAQEPLESLEEQMEEKAEKIEMAVEAMIERAFDGDDIDTNFEYEKETALDDLKNLVNQMKPNLKHIKVLAKEMEVAAEQFEQTVYRNYDEDDIDSIKVFDAAHYSTMHFDEYDMDKDFGDEARFDF